MKILGLILLTISMISFGFYGLSVKPDSSDVVTDAEQTESSTPMSLVIGGVLFAGAMFLLLKGSFQDVRGRIKSNPGKKEP